MHTLHSALTHHVYDGVIATVAQLPMPGLKVRGLSGVVGGTGGIEGSGMANMGQVEGETEQVA